MSPVGAEPLEIDPLTRLAIRHGTDKWGPHFYTPIYHELFAPLRDRPIRLLEIGVGGYGWQTMGGASLAMWAEYFPLARIVSLDVVPKQLDFGPRVTIVQGSQDDPALLEALSAEHGRFDVVIDDGSHQPEHQFASFEALFPRMTDAGLYVIEDVQSCFFASLGGDADGAATMRLAARTLRDLNHAELAVAHTGYVPSSIARQVRSLRAFHNLLVFEKAPNDAPSIFRYDPRSRPAAHALKTIEAELARDPSPGGFATLAMVLAASGDLARAGDELDRALAIWPADPALLGMAIDLFPQTDVRVALLDRLGAIEPPSSAALVERTRGAILRHERSPLAPPSVFEARADVRGDRDESPEPTR